MIAEDYNKFTEILMISFRTHNSAWVDVTSMEIFERQPDGFDWV
jgi:hypothetical protein